MTSETPRRLRASPSAPTRKDVHKRDQGDDHHRSDRDDGNRGCGDDHTRIVSGNLSVKTLTASGTARARLSADASVARIVRSA